MSNELVFVAELVFSLGAVLLCYKLFGKNGLFAYMAFAMLLSNIQVLVLMDLFGMNATGGNVMYASISLALDILSENHGQKSARKAVMTSFFVMLIWLAGTQITLFYAPGGSDTVYPALKELLSLAPRITLASLRAYIISQLADVRIFHLIKKKTGANRLLWLRKNGSTLISQLADTLIFTAIAFAGVVGAGEFAGIVITTYIFKAAVSMADTPFIYLARKIKPISKKEKAEQTPCDLA